MNKLCDSRIPNFEATVAQKLNQGTTPIRPVFELGALFLFLFWRSKKEKVKILGVMDILVGFL